MRAWHFLPEDCRLRHANTLIEVGTELPEVPKDELELCKRGYHASKRLIDALEYAPGPILCRVDMGGVILKQADKVCAQRRSVVWMQDISELLHHFACDEAEIVLKRHKIEGGSVWSAIHTKRKWLKGETSDEELGAARAAARAAAKAAARAAAEAARAAAWAAAWDAEADAEAAWAAEAAAWDAAWAAERNRQNDEITRRINALIEDSNQKKDG